ncbi:hypothetical protein BC829DRAFT_96182 [Chytridium lagenaria]|nr:hypothetical protein BC829DRAFT_96182 [Chytridium lagenaria]
MWHRRKKPSAHPEVAEASSSVPHHSKGMFISSVFKNMFKNPSASGDGERSFGKKMDRGTRGMVSQDSQRSMASFHSTRRNKPVALQVDECWVCGLEKAVDGSCACMSDSAPLAHVAPPMDTVAPPPVKIDGLAFTKEIPASPPTIFTPSSFVPRKSMSDSAPPSPQPSPKSSLSIEKRFETQVVALQSVFSKIKQTQKAKKETLLKNHLEKTLSGQGQRAASSDVRFGRDRSQRYQAKGDTTPMSYRPIYLEKSTSPVISARSMTTAPAFAVEPPAMSPRSPSEYLDTSKRGQDRSSKRFPLLIGLRAPSLRSDRDEKTPSVSGPASPRPSFSNPFHSLYNRPSRDIQRSPSCATPTTPTILQQKMRSPTRKFWPNGGKDLMVSESSAHLSAVTDPKPLVYEASQKALPPTPAPAPVSLKQFRHFTRLPLNPFLRPRRHRHWMRRCFAPMPSNIFTLPTLDLRPWPNFSLLMIEYRSSIVATVAPLRPSILSERLSPPALLGLPCRTRCSRRYLTEARRFLKWMDRRQKDPRLSSLTSTGILILQRV